MFQLSIDHGRSVTITDHPDRDEAHRNLIEYIRGADYYLRPIQTAAAHSSYELLEVQDLAEGDRILDRQPRSAGHAVIEECATDTDLPADPPYYAAAAALRWLDDHHQDWQHGSDADPGARYPLAVLTAAQAEGHHWFCAGTLLREAAQLAAVEPISNPDRNLLETLRHNAISRAGISTTPAELAAALEELLPASTSAGHTAALIWWFALLTWGAGAS